MSVISVTLVSGNSINLKNFQCILFHLLQWFSSFMTCHDHKKVDTISRHLSKTPASFTSHRRVNNILCQCTWIVKCCDSFVTIKASKCDSHLPCMESSFLMEHVVSYRATAAMTHPIFCRTNICSYCCSKAKALVTSIWFSLSKNRINGSKWFFILCLSFLAFWTISNASHSKIRNWKKHYVFLRSNVWGGSLPYDIKHFQKLASWGCPETFHFSNPTTANSASSRKSILECCV